MTTTDTPPASAGPAAPAAALTAARAAAREASLPSRVALVEVGPRDGLQNEPGEIALETKRALVEALADAGLGIIETGSFVSPRHVPRMADTGALFAAIERRAGVRYTALVPNERGLDAALAAGVEEVAVFAAVTESFSRANLNAGVDETLERYAALTGRARNAGLAVRGYLSCVLGCPFDGPVAPERVLGPTERLLEAGCHEVSLGDTIGTGTAGSTAALLRHLLDAGIPVERLAMHCHDTWGQALANLLVALQHGVATIDASVAGLGGCPFARGATGNVATEDVVVMLDGLGIAHGVDLDALVDAGEVVSHALGRENGSRAARAVLARRARHAVEGGAS